MALVGGIDSSTSATKVEVRDADDGRLWGSCRRAHPATAPPRSEQDPQAWWGALVQAWHDAGRYDTEALSVAGQQHGLVVLDEEGRVLRPAKLWNDTESAPDAAALVDALGPEQWARACGSVPVLVGGGARSSAYRQVLADLAGQPVITLAPEVEPVALGACVQAAAALHGQPPEEVAAAWGLGGAGTPTEPSPGDRQANADVRAAYRAAFTR